MEFSGQRCGAAVLITGRSTECTSWLGGSVVPTGVLDVLKKSFLHLPGKEPLFFSCLAGSLNTVSV